MSHRIRSEAERTGTRRPNFFEHWPVDGALLRSPIDYELLKKHCHAQKNVQKNVTDIVRICGRGSRWSPLLSKRVRKGGKRIPHNYPEISHEAFRDAYFSLAFAGESGGGVKLLDYVEKYLLEMKIVPYGRVFSRPSLPLVSLEEDLPVEIGEVTRISNNQKISEVAYTVGLYYGQQHSLVFGHRINNNTGRLHRLPQERKGLHLDDIVSYRLLGRINKDALEAMKHMNREKIPRVNWPVSDGMHKVIQLETEGTLYLRFGKGLSRTSHGAILEEMLNALEIPYKKMWIDSYRMGIIDMGQRKVRYTIPNPRSDRYTAVGMGFAQISTGKKEAEFYGKGEDYHLEINEAHLDTIRNSQPDWQIRVRGK